MAEYALTKDGSTVVQTRKFKEGETLPDFKGHPTKSAWKWFAVTRLEPSTGKPEGWKINKTTKTANYQQEFSPPIPRKVGSVSEFREAFPPAALTSLEEKFLTDANIRAFYLQALAAGSVDLEADAVLNGLAYAVSIGIMTDLERTAILEHDFDATD